jgi:hypothetical protein
VLVSSTRQDSCCVTYSRHIEIDQLARPKHQIRQQHRIKQLLPSRAPYYCSLPSSQWKTIGLRSNHTATPYTTSLSRLYSATNAVSIGFAHLTRKCRWYDQMDMDILYVGCWLCAALRSTCSSWAQPDLTQPGPAHRPSLSLMGFTSPANLSGQGLGHRFRFQEKIS